jgi:hypothetical protein
MTRATIFVVGAVLLLIFIPARAQDPQQAEPIPVPFDGEAIYDREQAARRARDAKRPDTATTSDELRAALSAPVPQSDLSLSVHVAPFKHSDEKASVALAIEIGSGPVPTAPSVAKRAPANKLELSFFSIDEKGAAGTGTRTELDLTQLKPETYERVKAHGIRFNPRVALAPGRYQLRVGARESSGGAIGSMFVELVVPDFRTESLAMSGLLLTSVSAQHMPTAEPDPMVVKLLPGAATSRREFPVGDTLAMYVELYDNDPSQQPHKIEAVVRLISERGEDVFTWSGTTARSRQSEHWNITRQIPLRDVSPGRYVLRVEARLLGHDPNPVARETAIAVIPTMTATPTVTVAGAPTDTTVVVDRAARYVKEFVSRFSSVVAEEAYIQQRIGPRVEGRRRRELTSDFHFIRPNDFGDWLVFRAVHLVDGKEVGQGENRLLELLTSPVADTRALDEALAESAQYGLPGWPFFNNPLIALGILQDQYRDRFDFSLDRSDPDLAVLRFRERVSPTILTIGRRNMFSEGRLWVDPRTGRISQTELAIGRNATVRTIFAHDERLKTDVPVEMRERYDSDTYSYSTGLAKYSNFRTFQVQTGEVLEEKRIP